MNDALDTAQSSLFGHFLKNGLAGFFKAAAIGLVLGGIAGAALFGFHIFSDRLLHGGLLDSVGGSDALAGALTGAAVCVLPMGAIGATAGINSTRDSRRYLRLHEHARDDAMLPPEHDPVAMAVMPELEKANTLSHTERLARETPSIRTINPL